MKQFIQKVLLFAAIQIAIGAYLLNRYPADRGTYMAATIDKHMLLERQTSPRIIFVGGSNVAFGLDSEMLLNYTAIPPVNMGLHAGLGLEFLTNEVEGELRAGDIVVLAPEIENFTKWGPYYFFQERVIEQRFANAFYIPLGQIPAALDRGLPFGLELLGNVFHRLPDTMAAAGRAYSRSGFNTYGDEVAHWGLPGNLDLLNKSMEQVFRASQPEAAAMTKQVNAFARRCQSRGIQVLFSYAPMPDSRLQLYRAEYQATTDVIEKNLEIPSLYKLESVCFPIGDFWDSFYHLNRNGVLKRTRLALDGLCPIVWKRKPAGAFTGVLPISGMGPHDDPPVELNRMFPELQLADCGWGIYPATVLSTEGAVGECQLDIGALALQPGRIMTVKVAGKELFKQDFAVINHLYDISVALNLAPNSTIELEYSGGGPRVEAPQRPIAILFKSIRLRQK